MGCLPAKDFDDLDEAVDVARETGGWSAVVVLRRGEPVENTLVVLRLGQFVGMLTEPEEPALEPKPRLPRHGGTYL